MREAIYKANVATLLGLFASGYGVAYADEFTGQYLATANLSTQTRLEPSLNNRVTANYAPSWMKGNFDFRIEQYTENSYHGVDNAMVRERKLEEQINYNYPLTEKIYATVGILHHNNFTFTDNYYWGVAGLVWNGDILPDTNLTSGVLAEKRNAGGRVFYDFSATLERRFLRKYGAFAAAHIYENLGESDITPTHKREFEVGVNYYPNKRYFAGISYFYHQQVGDPTDRFSMVKLKLGLNF
ncbi:hypothetical protein BTH42_33515 [Burkholderia sp. SRS-W-2-2016]|uniref:hypothetical protein n=1 Tax=Burkholderia sp. SRS-W-2-2016 TaxID=1926878 RepID=UPI00094B62B7|nr:hypothetical protein [Burkholderia sp. SRS-W-2-2016]OLL27254.1 hypothetical protein BTH42_33515 [Burkholderia sp. SRS-W-2-2016]